MHKLEESTGERERGEREKRFYFLNVQIGRKHKRADEIERSSRNEGKYLKRETAKKTEKRERLQSRKSQRFNRNRERCTRMEMEKDRVKM